MHKPTDTPDVLMDALQTAALLPYTALTEEIRRLLQDDLVQVPARIVQALPDGGSLFVMPAIDQRVAITKLITFTPANARPGPLGVRRPTIQGDVVVFDVTNGERRLVLDGPTVTARRTAAVSLLAARLLAPNTAGPLLIVGAGVQGKAHLEAFAAGLELQDVVISSRSEQSAQSLAQHARNLGLKVRVAKDPNSALADCPLVVTCTPASAVVLHALPRKDSFMAAVGAFTPGMVELSPDLCLHMAQHGRIVVDTSQAQHEAGDLLQAGLDVHGLATLAEVVRQGHDKPAGPVLFKSCGWAGWDLAAARLALRRLDAQDKALSI
ncbi:MAG: delta(1)-pyrroline-2-carboxylate reductase family protein [Gammaproteobacteria bacterium]|nr:delta(1)-pyrroline-2-carboxylate reductase family protein [Gammaproteobacteria bacterium]MBU0787823.1 delta(1)-pyrroline-2-carboxylate reductase family protein [Gammaproteobacteria bacterium]MBU0817058.1 delta(1)-pyrroline-2-carboxylate reductase family protein [Gammaproteobacteria bacterium]MBU1787222.1 delta(1)-pyrroline-2-carboxylate reductase family protein [Gammaproteobacteria bacterium]